MKTSRLLFGFYLLVFSFSRIAAQGVFQVNLEKIKQKKIRQLVQQNHLQRANAIEQLQPMCLATNDAKYYIHEKQFIIHGTINEVWEAYQTISPKNAWSGDMASFGFMYETKQHDFLYENDTAPNSEVGQVIFINLKMLKGLFHLAVAHKITEINKENHSIRTCYVKTGKSKGTQYISIKEMPDGTTKVIHKTLYLSGSNFRDTYLYPWLHGKVITEFHRNISHLVLLKQQSKLKKAKVFVQN